MQWLYSLMGRRNGVNGMWRRSGKMMTNVMGNNGRSRLSLIALGIGAIVYGIRRAR